MLTTYVLWWLILTAAPHVYTVHVTSFAVDGPANSATANVEQPTAREGGSRSARLFEIAGLRCRGARDRP